MRIIPFDTHSTVKLSPLAILKKNQFFSKDPSISSKKETIFERFEKSYYFSRILRQICYNLFKKITLRNVNEHRERHWQTSGKKDAPFLVEDFTPLLYKHGAK